MTSFEFQTPTEVMPLATINATQARHQVENIEITIEQLNHEGVWQAKVTTHGLCASGPFVQVVAITTTNDLHRIMMAAIQAADDVISERTTPPPAAPAAAKPKKPKKAKAGCLCTVCRCVASEGVVYCSADREWYVFDNNILVGIFPRKERLEAQNALNASRYERLRRAA